MTPTQAYRAALEAAATLADGMKAPIQDAANIAIGLPAFSKTVASLIRAMPVPEGLDDTDTGGTKCRFCGGRDDETALPVPKEMDGPRCIICGRKDQNCHCWDPAGDIPGIDDGEALANAVVQFADEPGRLRAENERLRALAVKAQWALQPFADCVFDDNGDLTVTVSYRAVTVSALRGAYFAYKAIRSALKGGE